MSPLSESAPAKPLEIVIPDCCNIGIMVKSLLFVNGVALTIILIDANSVYTGLLSFIEASMLIELASLTSLFALCGLRRIIKTVPPWGQRIACALVPAAITGLIIHYLLNDPAGMISLSRLSVPEGVVCAALFGIGLQHYFELRTRAFSPALAEARLQALQARIRPHFLFNSLNAVLSLIRTEPRRAETTLEDLADLFRILMRDSREITTLGNEVRIGMQYLSIEKIRLGERLQVKWDMDNIAGDVLQRATTPALLLQPLLENAVHYGVEPSHENAVINIAIARVRDRIEIVMTNPYHADVVSAGNHMALDNIRERLALLYDMEAQLTTNVVDGKFEVRLYLPYKKAAA
ncbi:MAG: histidine kinase [Herminiimonas sp.]|uniref:sensor histidine kinase n=1 Tax=Herminiimonas sp. TaxID=1926289 RepID=UPI002726B668|nr:histidine kinase [Herminiimonas sp.]MDO9421573.1 histidine kinase [Herminiimonas sp.]